MKDDPKYLYRYYRFDMYTEKIFTKNEIYFQKPSKFNDPLDSKITYACKGTVIEKQEFLKKNLSLAKPKLTEKELNNISQEPVNFEKFFNDFRKKNDPRRDELGIYCLTTLRDNILMWAHCSDNHKGFCLEFDGQGEFFQRALPVKYSKVLPTYNILEHTLGEPHRHADKFADLLLTKAEDWRYENEWRIVFTPEHGGFGIHTFPEKLLTGVILGFQISNENRNSIIEWCKGRMFKPKIYQATPKDGEFGLDIIPLDIE